MARLLEILLFRIVLPSNYLTVLWQTKLLRYVYHVIIFTLSVKSVVRMKVDENCSSHPFYQYYLDNFKYSLLNNYEYN